MDMIEFGDLVLVRSFNQRTMEWSKSIMVAKHISSYAPNGDLDDETWVYFTNGSAFPMKCCSKICKTTKGKDKYHE